MIGCLDAIDRAAGQIHDRVGAVEVPRPLTHRARIPGDMLPPRARWGLRTSRDRDDVVSGFGQVIGKALAEESRAAGNHDLPGPRHRYSQSATVAIQIADGTSNACASTVPAIRLPVSQTTDRRKCGSSTFPAATSSVINDK
jgi:hypothetical protein